MKKHLPASVVAKTSPIARTSRGYRKPALHSLGKLEQVQAYYHGSYRDGPNSYYWYK
ncbi:MAG: hypothetical protein U0840_28060 [Gemmataceae bacterium]